MATKRSLVGLLILAFAFAGLSRVAGADATAMIAARTKFFGAANVNQSTGAVDAGKVILSWFGVTNFAAAIGGHVVLLDAWVPKGEYSGYVPTSPDELASLQPEFIFAGHSHFDHLADSPAIMSASNATLVGTAEHCAQTRSQAMNPMLPCEIVFSGADAAGTRKELTIMTGVGLTAVKHVHSAGRQPDASDAHAPAAPPPDFGAVTEHQPAPQDTMHLLRHLGDGENGVILWQFRVGNFSLVWHDSSGPLKEDAPGVFGVLGGLPATDVQLGAIMGFNQITNGLRDPRMYIEAIHPKIFVPTHHDNWAPPVSTRAANYKPIVEDELQKIPAADRPSLLFIEDPEDYLNPAKLTFVVGDTAWD